MSFNSSAQIKKLDAKNLSFYRDSSGLLKVRIENENEEYAVKPIRCFPLTDAERYLGLFKTTPDGTANEEIALVEDVNRLDENSKKLVSEELNRNYSLTWIKKIYSAEQTKTTSKWRVETDKGEKTFEVLNHNDIYMVQPSLMVIEDVDGGAFLVNPDRLDPKSLSLLEIYT